MTSFPLSQDSMLEDRLAIVGTAGSGKTYTAGLLVERILDDGHRVIIVDPLGVWYGLRLKPDGETPSKFNPVIFGGKPGDGISRVCRALLCCIIEAKEAMEKSNG